MHSFKIGDRIIYPNQGLAVIEGIQQEHLYGEDFNFYRVRILCNKTLVLVPSGNTEEMGIRKLMSEDAVEEIFRYLEKAKELLIAEISEVSELSLREIEQRIAETLSLSFKSLKQNVEI